jgi:hypothetical protein
MSLDLPVFNDPFYRESMRPLKPTPAQLRDQRYHPTVEIVQMSRLGTADVERQIPVPQLPREGAIQVPVIL